ncbi:MAG: hypothetical protein C0506_13780 [Anaerolinea sp.]|nr:hypothetical protein [Anaerolinea sp.]
MDRRTVLVAAAASALTLALVWLFNAGRPESPTANDRGAAARPTPPAGTANQGPPFYTVADLGVKLAYARVAPSGVGTLVIETVAGVVDIPRAKGVFTGIAWSPDGQRLALSYGSSPDVQDIYVYDTESGDLKQLTADGRSRRPTWSPDGAVIAFSQGGAGNGKGPVFTISATGSDPKALSRDDRHDAPAWAPDGSAIAVSREPGTIVLISPSTGEEQKQVNLLRESTPTYSSLDWSPDGEALAAVVRVGASLAIVVVADKLTSQRQVGGAFLGDPVDPAWVHPSWVPGFPMLIAASETTGDLMLIDLAATPGDMPSAAPYSPVQVLVPASRGSKLAFPAVYGPRAAGGSSIVQEPARQRDVWPRASGDWSPVTPVRSSRLPVIG